MEANSLEQCAKATNATRMWQRFPGIAEHKVDNLQSAGCRLTRISLRKTHGKRERRTSKSEMCSLCPSSFFFFFGFLWVCISSTHITHRIMDDSSKTNNSIFPFVSRSVSANDSISTFSFFFYFNVFPSYGYGGCGDEEHINKFVEIRFVCGRWHIRSRHSPSTDDDDGAWAAKVSVCFSCFLLHLLLHHAILCVGFTTVNSGRLGT